LTAAAAPAAAAPASGALAAPANGGPAFDPAGVKNVGNGKGTQFIGGQCLSAADCASGCCANPSGICSGVGAQTQAGKTGCGFAAKRFISLRNTLEDLVHDHGRLVPRNILEDLVHDHGRLVPKNILEDLVRDHGRLVPRNILEDLIRDHGRLVPRNILEDLVHDHGRLVPRNTL
jgi:hypothetical protein